jgi:hypothetical protein
LAIAALARTTTIFTVCAPIFTPMQDTAVYLV